MTDNDFADPWGLTSTADDDDVGAAAPAEPPPAAEPTSEAAPGPPAAPDDQSEPEPATDEVPSPVEASPAETSTPIEVDTDHAEASGDESSVDTPDAEEEASTASSGPYSQVLAAASGLFGRSTTPAANEPVEIESAETDVETSSSQEAVAEADSSVDQDLDEIVDVQNGNVDVAVDALEKATGDIDAPLDDVEEVLSSLETSVPEVDAEFVDEVDEVDVELDTPGDTVSVEEIAAMASQLEVETPEPFEVSFTTADDVTELPEVDAELVTDLDIGESAQALLGVEESEISLDMDSAPSVFGELSESMDEADSKEADVDEPVPGGFDVGAVFHSEQDDSDDAAVEDLASDVAEEAFDTMPEAAFEPATDDHEPSASEDGEPDEALSSETAPDALEAADPFGAPSPFEEAAPDEAEPLAATPGEGPVVEDTSAAMHDVEPVVDSVETTDDATAVADEPADGHVAAAAAAATGVVAAATTEEDSAPSRFVDSGEVEWGARWHESAQGWVEDSSGQATWRPIVTTASALSEWEVDTYLGIVVGDSPVSTGAPMDTAMALSRQHAIRVMVDEALSRGAHAVIGVQLGVADVGSIPLATATGTAVTLKPGDA